MSYAPTFIFFYRNTDKIEGDFVGYFHLLTILILSRFPTIRLIGDTVIPPWFIVRTFGIILIFCFSFKRNLVGGLVRNYNIPSS